MCYDSLSCEGCARTASAASGSGAFRASRSSPIPSSDWSLPWWCADRYRHSANSRWGLGHRASSCHSATCASHCRILDVLPPSSHRPIHGGPAQLPARPCRSRLLLHAVKLGGPRSTHTVYTVYMALVGAAVCSCRTARLFST
ncbi:hypothetical protein BV20DRAFT_78995 [Pilatotrama ljubarskyi]|nr:hypothetical protein BV20DRAFT_78995 [Pilatotrama ljubarskyi]